MQYIFFYCCLLAFILLYLLYDKIIRNRFMIGKKYSEREIIDDIVNYIVDNHLTSGVKLKTAKEMAGRYNVSVMTINRALDKLTSKGVIYRRQGSGTFVSKFSPAKKKFNVKVFSWYHDESDPLVQAAYGTFDHVLLDGLENAGFTVNVSSKLPFHNKIFTNEHIELYDLLIVPNGMVNDSTAPLLRKLNIPIILISDDKLSRWPFHQVFHDYMPGFEQALHYVQKQKIGKIFIAGATGETSEYRCKILVQCAKRAKIHYEILPLMSVDYSKRPQAALVQGHEHGKYLIENNINGLVFSLSDFIAFGILDILKAAQMKIGEDIKLISYDNLEGRGVYANGQAVLTSINHPLIPLAQQTVKLAEHIARNKITSKDFNHLVRVSANKLVVRDSA
jgi:DNA-binding LacI/PurR family transcriptional regulator/DNA-binding transcriptional regulator YhcF (GntR family)